MSHRHLRNESHHRPSWKKETFHSSKVWTQQSKGACGLDWHPGFHKDEQNFLLFIPIVIISYHMLTLESIAVTQHGAFSGPNLARSSDGWPSMGLNWVTCPLRTPFSLVKCLLGCRSSSKHTQSSPSGARLVELNMLNVFFRCRSSGQNMARNASQRPHPVDKILLECPLGYCSSAQNRSMWLRGPLSVGKSAILAAILPNASFVQSKCTALKCVGFKQTKSINQSISFYYRRDLHEKYTPITSLISHFPRATGAATVADNLIGGASRVEADPSRVSAQEQIWWQQAP